MQQHCWAEDEFQNSGGSNDEKLTNVGTTLSTSVILSSLLPPTASVAALNIYEWSDIVEQGMIKEAASMGGGPT